MQPLPVLVPKSITISSTKPKIVGEKLYRSLDRRAPNNSIYESTNISPLSTYSFYTPLNGVDNYRNKTIPKNYITSEHNHMRTQTSDKFIPQSNMGILDAIPPKPTSSSSKSSSAGNLYYSHPSNIPVHPQLGKNSMKFSSFFP